MYGIEEYTIYMSGYPMHRENTGKLVCPTTKFPGFKGKRYFYICSENFLSFFQSWISLPSQFRVCNTNSYSPKLPNFAQGKFAIRQGKHREFENPI